MMMVMMMMVMMMMMIMMMMMLAHGGASTIQIPHPGRGAWGGGATCWYPDHHPSSKGENEMYF